MTKEKVAADTREQFRGIDIARMMYEVQWHDKQIQEKVDPNHPTSLRVRLSRLSMHELMDILIERRYVLSQTGTKVRNGEQVMATKKKHVEEAAPATPKKGKKEAAPVEVPAKKGKKEAAAPVEATAPRGRSSKYSGGEKITVEVKENPKREGTASAGRFDIYKNNMTVAKFLELGGTLADIAYDTRRGYISVA